MNSPKTYRLYVKVGGRWRWQCDIVAQTNPEALRQAIGMLRPEHYECPIRLEQVESKPGRRTGE